VPVINGTRCYTIVGNILFLHSTRYSHLLSLGLITFYLGILTLIIAVLTYVAMVASKPTKIVMSLVVAFTLLPTTYFIFLRPLFERSEQTSTSSVEIQTEERGSFASTGTAPPMPEPHPHVPPLSAGYITIITQPVVGPATPS